MDESQERIHAFWRWFEANRDTLKAVDGPGVPLWDALLHQLQQIDAHLWFELPRPVKRTRDFVITAEGQTEYFPLVETIAALAPRLKGWRVVALKPPMDFDFTTTHEGIEFDPFEMWFLPLASPSDPLSLGLRIAGPDFSPETSRRSRVVVGVILETAIGERSAALDIHYLETASLPEDPESEGYIELHRLPKYIEWHQRQAPMA